MKIRIQVILEHQDEEQTTITEEVGCFQRADLQLESLGLRLDESKDLLTAIQACLVREQTLAFIKEVRACPICGCQRSIKDNKTIQMRTLFGKFELPSPRLYTCACEPEARRSISPLAHQLPERTTPELKYLQVKWASLMSYGLTIDLLAEVLPLHGSTTTVRRHTHQIAQRLQTDLVAEEETRMYGIPMLWAQMPEPDPPLTVGIDGGYVHAREGNNRKAGWFEVIVGKSIPEEGDTKRFAFVHQLEDQPRRHLVTTLHSQGFSMRQSITFLSDGGDRGLSSNGTILYVFVWKSVNCSLFLHELSVFGG